MRDKYDKFDLYQIAYLYDDNVYFYLFRGEASDLFAWLYFLWL